jgi:CTP:molybdopterin cytidylyltransferase MocA
MAALILAAGESSRMGMFKPLARLGGCTFIEEAVDGFRRAGISDVRVVVGHRADELTPVLDALGVRWVLNPDHGRGMYASVLTGLASLESEIEAFFLLPVDIPLVRPRTLQQLAGLHDPSLPRIVYPRFDGKRGHPPLIPVALLGPELPADAPGGLRSILQGHEADALDVDVLDEAVLLDCDTPSDYRALLRRWQRRRVPSKRECAAIWDRFQVSGSIRAHGRLVAEVARIFAVHLTRAGITLDLPLIVAAGLLHDILRHQPDHARAGAGLLSELGFPRVGAVVALHMDIQVGSVSPSEAELVYLADKCVEESRLVSLEERFQRSLDRHGDRPEIRRKIQKRRDDAENIRKRFLAILGATPEDLPRRHERSILAASAEGPGKPHLARHGALQDPDEPRRFIGQMDVPFS